MLDVVSDTLVTRRYVLKLMMATGGGLFMLSTSGRLLAEWPAELFGADNSDDLIDRLTRGEVVDESDAVVLKVPALVENPAILPVSVECSLDDVKSISLLLASNRNPMVATFRYGDSVAPRLSTRVKLEGPGDVVALVQTSDRYYLSRKSVGIKAFACEPVKKQTTTVEK